MQTAIIIALLIALLAVIFALQNTSFVVVHFLGWKLQGSLALVVLVTFLLGVFVDFLASIPTRVRKNQIIVHQKKVIQELEENINITSDLMTPTEPVN